MAAAFEALLTEANNSCPCCHFAIGAAGAIAQCEEDIHPLFEEIRQEIAPVWQAYAEKCECERN